MSNNGNKRRQVNRNVSACLKDCKLFQNTDVSMAKLDRAAYKNENSYQRSFGDIEKFAKTVSDKDKKLIDCCVYNKNNDDGLFSAWVYYKFLEKNGLASDNIVFLPLSPASGNRVDHLVRKNLDKMKGRVVLICDIAYSVVNLKAIEGVAKGMYLVDDHPRGNAEMKALAGVDMLKGRMFIGDDKHSAVAYTWKFFFPDDAVPMIVQYIDNDDRKLNLPHLHYDRAFKTFISFRITHSPYIRKFVSVKEFKMLDAQIEQIDKNFMLTVGHYYDELVNNIKDQVAKNASFQMFQGHPVTVLNYNDPVLYKMVSRQMITNAERMGKKVDFAVLWGWEYTSNAYKVFLSEKHTGSAPRFNLGKMAENLGRKGGHPMGGKGTKYIGNFYWPRKNGQDIWDLFGK